MSIDEKPEAMAHIPDRVHDQLNQRGLTVSPSGKVIWCNDAPTHPKNWSLRRKIYDTGIITLSVTVSALVGNTGTSAARAAETELALSAVVANLAFASMFFFGQAVGGLLMPPYTESFGRKTTNIAVSATHAVACIVVAAPQSLAAIVVGRFLSGFLSAVPTVVGSGSIEDMWDVRARIWAIDLWIKGSIVGIALGPCMATYIGTSFLGWYDLTPPYFEPAADLLRHWIYYLSAILNSVVCLLFMGTHESRPSLLLARHVETVQRSTDFDELRFENADEVPSLHIFIRTMLIRPIRFFFTEPIVCAVSVISGTIFSSIYLQTEGLTVPYHEFGFDERGTSLVYLAWATGLLLTIPLRLNDWRIISRRIRRKEAVHPEDKLTGFFIASPILAAAFWCFSWTIPPLVSKSTLRLRVLLFHNGDPLSSRPV